MTFVGKVLVVVQLVLSVFFMAFAAAVYTGQNNWLAKHDALVESSAAAQKKLSDELANIKSENELLVKQVNDANGRADTLQARVEALDQQLASTTAELKVERDANIKEQAVSVRYEREAEFRENEAKSQRTRNDSLLDSREELVDQVQQLQDEKFNREEEIKKLIEKHNKVLLTNATYEKVIAANGLSTDPRDYEKTGPPPTVEGLVLSTRRGKRNGTEFVEISLGSDDGLLEGHDLHVYRTSKDDNKYLGKINIVYVAADRAVGTVSTRARNGSIQRGDNVKTNL